MRYKFSWNRIGLIFTLVVISVLFFPANSLAVEIKFINVSNLQDNNILTIENPRENDETEDSKIIGWKVTNSDGKLLNEENYNVKFESDGITLSDEDAKELVVDENYLEGQLFFRYVIGKSDEFNNKFVSEFKTNHKSNSIDYTEGKLNIPRESIVRG